MSESLLDAPRLYSSLFAVSRSAVREGKRKSLIVAVVGRELRLAERGGFFVGLCPFHRGKARSLVLDPRLERFACHRCGASGDAIDFLERLDGSGSRKLKRRG